MSSPAATLADIHARKTHAVNVKTSECAARTRPRTRGLRIEFDVQFPHRPEHPGRLIAEMTVRGWVVAGLRQADVARALQQSFDADPALRPGKRTSGTRVDAAAEGE